MNCRILVLLLITVFCSQIGYAYDISESEYKKKIAEYSSGCKFEISIPKYKYKTAYLKIWSDCGLSEPEVAEKFKRIINETQNERMLVNVTSIRYQGYIGYSPHWQNWFLYQDKSQKQGLSDFHEYFKASYFSRALVDYGLCIKEISNEQPYLIGSNTIDGSKENVNYFNPGVYLMIKVGQCDQAIK